MFISTFLLILTISDICLSSSVISGDPYCTPSGQGSSYAVPGTNITVNCSVITSHFPFNVLIWYVPSYGVQIIHIDDNPNDVQSDYGHPEFVSTVIASNNSYGAYTTTASLQFPAVSDLDGAVVRCDNIVDNITSCILQILTIPSPPNNLTCTNITFQSVTLQWSQPTDNGGESISHYSLVWFPNSVVKVTENMSLSITGLLPNIEYTFTVSASNSVGIGNGTTMNCTTLGELPPRVGAVSVCLDWNINDNTALSINYMDCPVIITNTASTPPVTNYTISAGQSFIQSLDPSIACSGLSQPVTEGDTYNVSVSVYNIIGANTTRADPFIAAWLRDVNVIDDTNSSVKIQYTTADCVVNVENLYIELIVKDGSNIVNSTRASYSQNTRGIFTLKGFQVQPNATLSYTAQVMYVTTIGTAATGSFIVTSTISALSTSATINLVSSPLPNPSNDPGVNCFDSVGMTVGITVPITAIVTAIITAIISSLITSYCCVKSKGVYSPSATSPPALYEIPVSNKNVSSLEMKDNMAYGHVTIDTSGNIPTTSAVYETVTI